MAFKDFEALKKAVLKKAKEGMDSRVLPIVQTKMNKAIRQDVYAVYDPVEYVRRYTEGGLIDDDNIVGSATNDHSFGFDYEIENITKPSHWQSASYYLAPLIIMGQEKAKSQGYPVLYHDYSEYRAYGKPRDFMRTTKGSLTNRLLADYLEDYMNSR